MKAGRKRRGDEPRRRQHGRETKRTTASTAIATPVISRFVRSSKIRGETHTSSTSGSASLRRFLPLAGTSFNATRPSEAAFVDFFDCASVVLEPRATYYLFSSSPLTSAAFKRRLLQLDDGRDYHRTLLGTLPQKGQKRIAAGFVEVFALGALVERATQRAFHRVGCLAAQFRNVPPVMPRISTRTTPSICFLRALTAAAMVAKP